MTKRFQRLSWALLTLSGGLALIDCGLHYSPDTLHVIDKVCERTTIDQKGEAEILDLELDVGKLNIAVLQLFDSAGTEIANPSSNENKWSTIISTECLEAQDFKKGDRTPVQMSYSTAQNCPFYAITMTACPDNPTAQ